MGLNLYIVQVISQCAAFGGFQRAHSVHHYTLFGDLHPSPLAIVSSLAPQQNDPQSNKTGSFLWFKARV